MQIAPCSFLQAQAIQCAQTASLHLCELVQKVQGVVVQFFLDCKETMCKIGSRLLALVILHRWKSIPDVQLQNNAQVASTEVFFPIHEKIRLHGLECRVQNPGTDKWIVFFLPNDVLWQEKEGFLANLCQQTKANVLCFNYRNRLVRTEEDLYADGIAIVQDLLKKGVKKEDILVHGWSFGGPIATHVAALLELSVCNERSYSSFSESVRSSVPKKLETSFFFANLMEPVLFGISCILEQLNWGMDTTTNLSKLNKKVIVISNPKDKILPPPAQFIRKVYDKAPQIRNEGRLIEIELKDKSAQEDSHDRPWHEDEWEIYRRSVHTVFYPGHDFELI